jgi:hypothetical protein
MAITQIDIVNTAMFLIGEAKLSSTADAAKSARIIKTLWEISYQGQLVLPFDWKFATTTAQLSQLTDPVIGHYEYRYALPAKCLRVVKVVDEDDYELHYPYRREVYVDGNQKEFNCILTNESECYIRYLRDISNVALWPAWFSRLVALDLAILSCEPLKQDKQKKSQLLLMRDEPVIGWLPRAIAANAMEDADTGDGDVDTREGNRDVIEAASLMEGEEKTYIVERES